MAETLRSPLAAIDSNSSRSRLPVLKTPGKRGAAVSKPAPETAAPAKLDADVAAAAPNLTPTKRKASGDDSTTSRVTRRRVEAAVTRPGTAAASSAAGAKARSSVGARTTTTSRLTGVRSRINTGRSTTSSSSGSSSSSTVRRGTTTTTAASSLAAKRSAAAAASKTKTGVSKSGVGKSSGSAPLIGGFVMPKRSAWDYKARVADLDKYVAFLTQRIEGIEAARNEAGEQLAHSQAAASELEAVRTSYQEALKVCQEERDALQTEHDAVKAMLASAQSLHRDEVASMRTAHQTQLQAEHEQAAAELARVKQDAEEQLANTNAVHQQELAAETQKHEAAAADAAAAKELLEQRNAELAKLQAVTTEQATSLATTSATLSATQATLTATQSTLQQREQSIEQMSAAIELHLARIADLEARARDDEMVRRSLHNELQELKGNIRVFARVRPIAADDTDGMNHVAFPEDHQSIQLWKAKDNVVPGKMAEAKEFAFTFDRVFQPSASQEDVFAELSQLVQSALDGYHCCVFAYGQTGSGKTHTMEGDVSCPMQRGMIPRAVEQIFMTAERLRERGWEYTFEASYLEIYNETIRDLLQPGSKLKHDVRMVGGAGSSATQVTNLKIVPVTQPDEMTSLLETAKETRAVGATQCNDRSSRSHSVFQLRINGSNSLSGKTCNGLLNLIDLAGSERLSKSGSANATLKETQAINKSLSSLGDVIAALANREKHVPYRNSKLTHLLQSSLGGSSSKTLMMVNVDPSKASLNESLCTLRFATKVNACDIGSARKATRISL